MSDYENSKKARRIASVIYLVIMAVIMTGTYFSQQQKEALRKGGRESQVSAEIPGGETDALGQN